MYIISLWWNGYDYYLYDLYDYYINQNDQYKN